MIVNVDFLEQLIAKWESEIVEFKQASSDFPTSTIGKYFSALANEANLHGVELGWLVFGVSDKARTVVGTDYREDPERLQSLKNQIADGTEPKISFRNIHELHHPDGRVVLFDIPAAPTGMPISWNGHYFAREGESLSSLSLGKLDTIREQVTVADWSAEFVPDATLNHLDEAALEQARESFSTKHANRFPSEEVRQWPLDTFLRRAKITRDGKLTRAALLLLGKPDSAHLLLPHPAQMTWKLVGSEQAYEHFGPPFLLNTSELYQRIRNIQLRILPNDALIASEISKYDRKVVLEALHNCIAHQDYSRNGRIVVTELPDRLTFENEGNFFDGHPEDYAQGNKTPRRYRNPVLAQAMVELNMIDTIGYGIYEMHMSQARRYFPMPDFDLSTPNAVHTTIHGKIIDPAYSRLLMQKTRLPLADIIALDRVQKHLSLDDPTLKRLRRDGLVEGRKPNLHVSASVAKATESKLEYIRTRAQDDAFYAQLVIDLLRNFDSASRSEINELLWDKLSEALDSEQKSNKIGNLLTKLRRSGRIRNAGSRRAPKWKLAE